MAAKVEQVSYIGYNGLTTSYAVTTNGIDIGDELIIHINFPFDKSLRSLRTWNRSFTYTAVADNSGDTAMTNLVNQINADPVCSEYLTAARTTDSGTNWGISFTAKALTHSSYSNLEQVSFEVFLDGDDWETATAVDQFGYIEASTGKTATNSNSGKPSSGVGTYDQVLDLERFALGFWG